VSRRTTLPRQKIENSEQKQPLPLDSKAQAAIETAAQAVLDARAQFPTSSLADLYDPLTMPPALLKAHQKLDAAVDKAYEACGGKKAYKNDAERVAFLFELYLRLTSLGGIGKAGKSKRKANSKPRRRNRMNPAQRLLDLIDFFSTTATDKSIQEVWARYIDPEATNASEDDVLDYVRIALAETRLMERLLGELGVPGQLFQPCTNQLREALSPRFLTCQLEIATRFQHSKRIRSSDPAMGIVDLGAVQRKPH
jgi:hypothetical protein